MSRQYFIRINGEQRGPYRLEELPEAGVTPDTFVWHKGMDDWNRARHDAEICRLFRQRLSGDVPASKDSPADSDTERTNAENLDSLPWGFRGFVERDGTPIGPPQDEKPDLSVPPRSRVAEAIIVTLFCSVLGLVAVYFAFAARKAWNQGKAEEAYDLTRKAKMWIGISFFVGMICTAFVMRSLIG